MCEAITPALSHIMNYPMGEGEGGNYYPEEEEMTC